VYASERLPTPTPSYDDSFIDPSLRAISLNVERAKDGVTDMADGPGLPRTLSRKPGASFYDSENPSSSEVCIVDIY
jgi:hypothetical protein